MKLALLFHLFLLCGECVEASLHLQPALPEQRLHIEKKLHSFYVNELLEAGLFTDYKEAEKAAVQEDAETKKMVQIQYFELISKQQPSSVGFIVFYVDETQKAYLDAIYIKKAHRNQGYGTKALQALEQHLQKEGLSAIQLYVFDHNQTALNFYKKMGFQTEETFTSIEKVIGHIMSKQF